MEKVLRNSAQCLKCDTEIQSTHVHDFKRCLCGNVFVDGGRDYIRHGYTDGTFYLDTSLTHTEK